MRGNMVGRALITGGQRGLGLGIAEALAADGWRLDLIAERPNDDADVAAALERFEDARYHRHDLREVAAVEALLDATGTPDALVLNAGIAAPRRGDMLEMRVEDFDLVMDVNARGSFFLAQGVARRWLAAPPGTVARSMIFMTSISATHASIERAEYCLSKSAAAMAAQLFAARLAPHGIAVFDLRPGIMATSMTESVREQYDEMIPRVVPAGRWGTPMDVGRAARLLVSGELGFATGAVLPLDGGLSIARL